MVKETSIVVANGAIIDEFQSYNRWMLHSDDKHGKNLSSQCLFI